MCTDVYDFPKYSMFIRAENLFEIAHELFNRKFFEEN